jgi:8-oxo-dGTP pyrophosphatase MutT (NUDIX family)
VTPRKPPASKPAKTANAKLPVRDQTSAGGVVYRIVDGRPEVVLIGVGQNRWQLPKGLVESGEKPERAAVREAHEEAGVESEVVDKIETIEYWFAGLDGGERVRFHKRVHLFLLRYLSGDPKDHDWEVNEARWFPLNEAVTQLTFASERGVADKARDLIARLPH